MIKVKTTHLLCPKCKVQLVLCKDLKKFARSEKEYHGAKMFLLCEKCENKFAANLLARKKIVQHEFKKQNKQLPIC